MKKVILSIAIIAGLLTVTNLQTLEAATLQDVTTITEDDGFVEVKLENLNEQVQASVNALAREYDVKSIKYNAEKKLSKVTLLKRDDQTEKTVYFDDQGKKVEKDKTKEREMGTGNIERPIPTA